MPHRLRRSLAAMLVGLLACVAIPVSSAPARAAGGGPVILDGTDSGLHGSVDGSGVPQGTWRYAAKAYENLKANVANGGTRIAVVGAADSTATGNNCGAMAHYAAADPAVAMPVDYYDGAAAVEAFLEEVDTGTATPAILHIVESNFCQNGLLADEAAVLAGNAAVIADFVNAGGALFAQYHDYAWLTALLPDAAFSWASGSTPALTEQGQAVFPGLTNADIKAPYHGKFSGDLGGLAILAAEGGQDIIVGGSSVTLPGSLRAETVTSPLHAGADAEVAVTFSRSGAPVAGVELSLSVTDGPNAGASDTGTTDAQGEATLTYTGGSVTGTDTVEVTADNAGDISTVTTTVVWRDAPGAPRDVAADRGDGEAVVRWSAPVTDGGSTITSYQVTVSPGTGVAGATRRTVAAPAIELTFGGLSNGIPYTFSVAAVSAIGAGAGSAAAAVIPATVPGVPTTVQATAADGRAMVSWATPATDGGSPVVSYDVTVSPAAGITGGATRTVVAPVTSLSFDGLVNGVAYTFTVLARNAVGAGAASAESAAVAPVRRRSGGDDDPAPTPTPTPTPATPATPPVDAPPPADSSPPPVRRLSGAGRVDTAAALSRDTFAPGVPVVYLVAGGSYADALAAGPAAARAGGPVLLVDRDGVPQATQDELARLRPARIVVLGGSAAVDAGVEASVVAQTGATVERLHGGTRYETAAAVVRDTFAGPVDVVYVATGEGYADSLAGGPAAATDAAPVLLVSAGGIPDATRVQLDRLRPDRVVVLGGTAAVPDGVERELAALTANVERVGGRDRYATAIAVSRAAFPLGSDTVYVASGSGFADALAGTPVAAASGAPVLLVSPAGVTPEVEAELRRLGASRLVVLGGTAAVPRLVVDHLQRVVG